MLLTADFHKNFIDVEGIAVASVLPLQSPSVNSSELDAPQPDRLPGDENTPFSEQIFDISVAQVESVVEPDGIADDVRWESVALVGVHGLILVQISDLT